MGGIGEVEVEPVEDADDEEAAAQLGHPVVGGQKDGRTQLVAQCSKVVGDFAASLAALLVCEALVAQSGDVLQKEGPRAHLVNDCEHVPPEPRALVLWVCPGEPPALGGEGLAT